MSIYRAPLNDMTFLLDEVLQAENRLGHLPNFSGIGVGSELTSALLAEANRLAGEVIAPLRRLGDTAPASCEDKVVTLTPGYGTALEHLGSGGWFGISAATEFGGQGLPELYATAVCEIWNGADMAFALAPILSIGAALAINTHGTATQKQIFLKKMNSGQWLGTMNLTESGAGSDLGALKAKAIPEGDHYRIYGQKIFISWGDHEASENIVHLILARLPDAPQGSRGVSLFIVPKYLVNSDGSIGPRNDVFPISCEHKLGIHGSPTCVMAFGDDQGAVGYMLGEENQGLACMFTMMNEARLKIGVQSLGAAQAAFQQATDYARERIQGGAPIIKHPDVKRMLLTMKCLTEAMRALAYSEAQSMDLADSGSHDERSAYKTRVDLMIPVLKTWISEVASEIASLGVQVHGGMGYVEETGAAQYLRDIRITSIYEGTSGIQASDLTLRKLGRDAGAAMRKIQDEILVFVQEIESAANGAVKEIGVALARSLTAHQSSTIHLLRELDSDRTSALGVSFDYLMQTGYLFGGWQLACAALVAARKLEQGGEGVFYERKISTALYYCQQVLPRSFGHEAAILTSGSTLSQYRDDWI